MWKARFALNIKKVPYKTVWIEYPAIREKAQSLEPPAAPTEVRFGEPLYTLPILHDPNTGRTISESFEIVKYLDETYTSYPPSANGASLALSRSRLIPEGTESLHKAFVASFFGQIPAEIFTNNLQATLDILNPPSREYMKETKERSAGMTVEEMTLSGERLEKLFSDLEAGLGMLDGWYVDKRGKRSEHFVGESFSFADFVLGGFFLWLRIVWGEESMGWKRVMSWHEGRWKKLMDALKEFERVV